MAKVPETAVLEWQTQSATPVLWVAGSWTLHQAKPDLEKIWRNRPAAASCVELKVEAAQWDSSLLALIRRLQRLASQQSVELQLVALPSGVERLLKMAETPSVQATEKAAQPVGAIARFGLLIMAIFSAVGKSCEFVGEVLIACWRMLTGKGRMRLSDFWDALQQCGPGALPIVALIASLVGLILAFVGAAQLEAFGAQLYIANMVAIGMTREMGALMTAVIMAGRTGAAYAAELGSMQANEEVDALKTFGFPPLEFLVLPRLLALLISMPILTVFADALGIFGGFVIGAGLFDISATQYINQSLEMLTLTDFMIGLFKSLVFAILIGLIGCYYGLNSGRNAQAVGKATTGAVVSIIVALVVSDAMITLICTQLGI